MYALSMAGVSNETDEMPSPIGHITEHCGGKPCPQSNDTDIDDRGLIYLVDRYCGFDVLEFNRK